jgi:hypothetical protein
LQVAEVVAVELALPAPQAHQVQQAPQAQQARLALVSHYRERSLVALFILIQMEILQHRQHFYLIHLVIHLVD